MKMTTKGVEIKLPKDVGPFKDKEKNPRKEIRIKWWESAEGKTFEQMLFPEDKEQDFDKKKVPPSEIEKLSVYNDSVPVFFGHYWIDPLKVHPSQAQTKQICCLDYSVAKKGLLVAYRWDGQKELSNDKFVWAR